MDDSAVDKVELRHQVKHVAIVFMGVDFQVVNTIG